MHRSVMQSMPVDWQRRMVALLNEANKAVYEHDIDIPDRFEVRLRDERGRYLEDPLADYERGRRRLWVKEPEPQVERDSLVVTHNGTPGMTEGS